MKILMIHPHDIYSPNEPWTIRIVSLARELRAGGHEVRLAYCPLEINEPKRKVDLDGIKIIRLSRKTGLRTILNNLKEIRKHSLWAEIIHFQKCFHYVSVPVIICGWLLDKPLHYDWDDWEEKIWYHSNRNSIHTIIFGNFLKLLERLIPGVVDTISVSSSKLEELCIDFGIKNSRIAKAPVGADLKEFNPHISGGEVKKEYRLENKTIILYLGQLHGGQYVRMFIDLANIVLHKYRHTVFLIVGQGYMLAQLEELVKKLGIKDRVIFAGSVSHERMPHYVAAADICVAPFEENEITMCKSPLKIVEYLASGKPIVASLVGEVRNMIGGAGITVGAGSSQALADAVMGLLKDKQLMQEMQQRARHRAESRYSWGHTAESLLNIYGKSLNEPIR